MTPEVILRPLLKKYTVPDTLARLLFLLIQREIETNFRSLSGASDPLFKLAKGLDYIFAKLPPIYEDGPFKIALYTLAGFTDDDTARLFNLSRPVEREAYYAEQKRLRGYIETYQSQIDRGESDGYAKSQLRYYKEQLRELKEPEITPYLSQFWRDLLFFNVGYRLPERIRPQHTLITGVSGTGKSELIKRLVYQDMQTDAAVIVMAPKGNLVSDIARIPHPKKTYIADWSNVGLNLLSLDPSLLLYVFESLQAGLTSKQQAFLTMCAKEATNLAELRKLISSPPARYKDTDDQLAWRFDLLLQNETVEQIFSRETTLDLQRAIDDGQVLLLDTKSLGDIASPFIGRFIIALLVSAIKNRQSKRLAHVYIDESDVYLNDYIEEIIDRAREARVCLTLAHQRLSQFPSSTEQAVLAMATKYAGRVVPEDARKLAPLLLVEPSFLTHREDLQFVLYAHGFLRHPLYLSVKPGFLDSLPIPPTPAPTAPTPPIPTVSQSTEDDDDPTSKIPKC